MRDPELASPSSESPSAYQLQSDGGGLVTQASNRDRAPLPSATPEEAPKSARGVVRADGVLEGEKEVAMRQTP